MYDAIQPFSTSRPPQFLICFSHHQYPPTPLIWSMYVEQFKSSKFSSSHFTGESTDVHPHFQAHTSLFRTLYHSMISSICVLWFKRSSVRRKTKKKKRKKEKNKKKLYPANGINEHDQHKGTD